MKRWLILEIDYDTARPVAVVATGDEAYQQWLDRGGREGCCQVYLIDVETCTIEDVFWAN